MSCPVDRPIRDINKYQHLKVKRTQWLSAAFPEMASQAGSKETVQLKRELGVIAGTSHMMGSMIGSGIFVSASSALRYTGSVGLCLIVWASCGFLCFLGTYQNHATSI